MIRKAEVNGYLVAWPPSQEAVVTAHKPPEVSPVVVVREAVEALWSNQNFRIESASYENAKARYGNVHVDKAIAAQAIYEWLKKNQRLVPKLVALGEEKSIGRIATHWLPTVIKERGWGRQAIFQRTIEDGRAAQARREAAAAARNDEQPQA